MMKKGLCLVLAVLLAVCVFVGCAKDLTLEEVIIGTWKNTPVLIKDTYMSFGLEYNFKEDGTVEVQSKITPASQYSEDTPPSVYTYKLRVGLNEDIVLYNEDGTVYQTFVYNHRKGDDDYIITDLGFVTMIKTVES